MSVSGSETILEDFNVSGLHPLGHHVLIKPDDPLRMTESGIVIPDPEDRQKEAKATGTVIEVGETAWLDYPGSEPWVSQGDHVIYAKYAGMKFLGKDGSEYRIMNDADIVATVDPDFTRVETYGA